MRTLSLVTGAAVFLAAAEILAAGPPRPSAPCPPRTSEAARAASADLSAFYHAPDREPPWREPLHRLKSADPAARRGAVDHLLSFLDLALLDEAGGRPAPEGPPISNEFPDNPARACRVLLARDLLLEPWGPDAMEPAAWLLSEEPDGATGNAVLKRLQESGGGIPGDLLRRLLGAPVRNPGIHRKLLEAAAERRGAGCAPEIRTLCGHPQKSIRTLARALTEGLHWGPVPDFEPGTAVTDWLDRDLRTLVDRVAWPMPERPIWMHVRLRTPGTRWDGSASEMEFGGWLLEEVGRTVTMLDWRGDRVNFDRGTADITRPSLAEEMRAVAGERVRTPGMAPFRPDLRELLMAAWAYVLGDARLAAEMLLPLLYPDDIDPPLAEFGLEEIGTRTHHAMLTAFRDLRDYPKTRFFARHLARSVFDGHRDQPQAIELDAQLERRTEDFVTLLLPTEPEWAGIKRSLSRSAQFEYLVRRLRLLNCFETRIWEPYPYHEPQSAIARWTWDVPPRFNLPKPVINPYVELRALEARPEEVGDLARHLDDRSFILAYTCRHAVGERCPLHRVRWILAGRINSAAGFPLAGGPSEDLPSDAAMEAESGCILAWARNHAGQTEEALWQDQLAHSIDAREVVSAARRLAGKKTPGLQTLVLQRMAQFPDAEAEFACLCHDLDLPELVREARLWGRSKNPRTRYWASRILLRHGDRGTKEGLRELQEAMESDECRRPRSAETLEQAALDLLKTADERAVRQVCALLRQPGFRADSVERGEILKALFLAGQQEAVDFLLAKLAGTADAGAGQIQPAAHDGVTMTAPVAHDGVAPAEQAVEAPTTADEVAHLVAGWSGEEVNPDDTPEEKAKKKAALEEWLKKQFAAVKAGKPPAIGAGPGRSPKK